MKMKALKILIPTDFSEISEKALKMASLLAEKIPVNIHLLHVVESPDDTNKKNQPSLSDPVDWITFQHEIYTTNRRFDELKNKGYVFEGRVSLGRLIDGIIEFTDTEEIDLVIMGTGGSQGIAEILAGSNAQHIVRYLKVPVITIKYDADILPLTDILFVSDFEDPGKPGDMRLVNLLAATFNSTIHLLQITTEQDLRKIETITTQMTHFAELHQISSYQTHVHQQNGILKGVQNFNGEEAMGLVCIRTHGRKGINHLLFGSIAEKLVNRCSRPVLTFHLTT